jgi:hypothetical protein
LGKWDLESPDTNDRCSPWGKVRSIWSVFSEMGYQSFETRTLVDHFWIQNYWISYQRSTSFRTESETGTLVDQLRIRNYSIEERVEKQERVNLLLSARILTQSSTFRCKVGTWPVPEIEGEYWPDRSSTVADF